MPTARNDREKGTLGDGRKGWAKYIFGASNHTGRGEQHLNDPFLSNVCNSFTCTKNLS